MEYLTAEQAREKAKQARLETLKDVPEFLFKEIEDACNKGNFMISKRKVSENYVLDNKYFQIQNGMHELGYKVEISKNGYGSYDIEISWYN